MASSLVSLDEGSELMSYYWMRLEPYYLIDIALKADFDWLETLKAYSYWTSFPLFETVF